MTLKLRLLVGTVAVIISVVYSGRHNVEEKEPLASLHTERSIRRIEKIGNALVTELTLEEFFDKHYPSPQVDVETLVIPVHGIYDINLPPEAFYARCLENVRKAWPHVKLIHLQGGEYIYYPDNSDSPDVLVPEAKHLKRLFAAIISPLKKSSIRVGQCDFLDHLIFEKDIYMSEVLSELLATKVFEKDLIKADVDVAIYVHGVKCVVTFDFNTMELFRLNENVQKLMPSLGAPTSTRWNFGHRRFDANLPQRCIKASRGNSSSLCVPNTDRRVDVQSQAEGNHYLCCDFWA
ncbi:unnamed protein product [Bursaphelenchus okinawaensis]|uniref:Uncharacterized protein n=1 Tax=Bursaphelenchus okinawaensis TaxID=465554 RepID=A0A811JUY4_9BILA|nr:unnamed protein product [Bursaphelenchus okinawaensis]CAG9085131.1 unnamed protein product [Bursaphelenchus okinawaensis]